MGVRSLLTGFFQNTSQCAIPCAPCPKLIALSDLRFTIDDFRPPCPMLYALSSPVKDPS